jgi:UDP-N-acetylmuramyl pentapeptide phosphotransferase/UDP-N-acetylglucosamine-1-phosphate transferase
MGRMNFNFFLLLGTVFLASYWATAKLANSKFSNQLLDHPNERSLHENPTPKTGGIAILAGIFIGFVLQLKAIHSASLISFSTVFFLGIISFWDVKSGLPQGIRLASHGLASLAMVCGVGLTLQMIPIPWVGDIPLRYFSIPITILTLTWFTNLYNFMDGLDGFAGGMAVFGFGFFGIVGWMNDHPSFAIQSWIIATAACGFLLHNLPPAKIFMGDVGSIPLGFLAGTFAIRAYNQKICSFWVPLLIFSPFIFDATMTVTRRIIAKKKFWQAHREHAFQKLVLAGWPHSKTVRAGYVLMLASGVSALFFDEATPQVQLVILMTWFVVYFVLTHAIGLYYSNFIKSKQ